MKRYRVERKMRKGTPDEYWEPYPEVTDKGSAEQFIAWSNSRNPEKEYRIVDIEPVNAETTPWRDCPQCGYVGTYSTFDGDVCYVCNIQNSRKRKTLGVILVMSALCIVGAVKCRAGVVTDSFIQRVALRESGNNPKARGKAGERGPWQMKPIAVKDVQARYGWKHTFQEATTTHARAYAEAYLIMCEVRFLNHYKRNPSEVELYRVWNRGFRGATR